jgi:glucose/arabinose dehydrogenase
VVRWGALAAAVGAVLAAGAAGSGAAPARLHLVTVARGLDSPLYVASTPSEPSRIYVGEQPGVIRVIDGGRLRAAPFLDIRRLVSSGGERGLLSMAFHPKYATNHRFYVDYTDVNGNTRVVEYRSNGTRALPGSARQLFEVDQPYPNHNGGQLQFGPDGLLYVGMGDGGSGGDPENRAQNLSQLLGKLLTFDVDRSGARPRVAAYGLRNPWRFTFDRSTRDLYIGDVGQGEWEEIDYLRRGALGKGLVNFGWNRYEGQHVYEQGHPFDASGRLVFPIAEYSHSAGCSVTGGYVYRGRAVPAARGRYFYGDYCSGTIWSLKVSGGKATGVRREAMRVSSLSSFGEDTRGELYLTSLEGTVYRLAG